MEECQDTDNAHHADNPEDAEDPNHRKARQHVALYTGFHDHLHNANKHNDHIENVPSNVGSPEEIQQTFGRPTKRQLNDKHDAEDALDGKEDGHVPSTPLRSPQEGILDGVRHPLDLPTSSQRIGKDQHHADPLERPACGDAVQSCLRRYRLRLLLHDQVLVHRLLPALSLRPASPLSRLARHGLRSISQVHGGRPSACGALVELGRGVAAVRARIVWVPR
mmetsp:Transcript_116385/g.324301  ORF Transcript_116385/g.324301 Transcript_116385/m.324301 type:complete len:221 (+) Transcript_116385:867-1529(+)